MELRTIYCNVKGCKNKHAETSFNQGHPEWGHLAGRQNPETGEEVAHLCPEHTEMYFNLLQGA